MSECSVEGCIKPIHSKKLCQPHYRKLRRNGHLDPVPIGRPRSPDSTDHRRLDPEEKERRKLERASTWEARTHCVNGHEFTPENTYRYSYGRKQCKICRRDSQRRHHGLPPLPPDTPLQVWPKNRTHCPRGHEYDRVKSDGSRSCSTCINWGRKERAYGITKDDYDGLWRNQRGACAICNEALDPDNPRDANIDHDHVTGKVRAILCSRCNTGLGQFRDSVDFLVNAAAYIERHSLSAD